MIYYIASIVKRIEQRVCAAVRHEGSRGLVRRDIEQY
jgi:hypothetical protein